MDQMKALSYDLRRNVVDMIMAGKGGHIGGDMSVLDILAELYLEQMNVDPSRPDDPDRDRLILSKGHSVEALYAVLAKKGFFPIEEAIREFSQFGSKYIGHPTNKVAGIEMNSGSLGHGLSVGVGMALAGKMDGRDYRVYVVMGDGELAEGSVWEGVMSGSHYQLDNLCAVIDRNQLQISGCTEDVMAQAVQEERWSAFGWNVISVTDGNDYDELRLAFRDAKTFAGAPTVIVAHTVKGYGSSLMENRANWHHHLPSQEEYEQIISDFEKRKAAL